MPATVIAERVGWDGSASWFRKQVALLPVHYSDDAAVADYWRPARRYVGADTITSTGGVPHSPSPSAILTGENHRSHWAWSPGRYSSRSAGSRGA
jgi:hypothetical protein